MAFSSCVGAGSDTDEIPEVGAVVGSMIFCLDMRTSRPRPDKRFAPASSFSSSLHVRQSKGGIPRQIGLSAALLERQRIYFRQKHTSRAILSAGGSLTKGRGLIVTSEKVGDKRIYSIKS